MNYHSINYKTETRRHGENVQPSDPARRGVIIKINAANAALREICHCTAGIDFNNVAAAAATCQRIQVGGLYLRYEGRNRDCSALE